MEEMYWRNGQVEEGVAEKVKWHSTPGNSSTMAQMKVYRK
jgi:hypothetical protein